MVSLSLPPANRGLTCCDASVYLGVSNGAPGYVWHHSSIKVFGYPFYLSLFRYAFQGVCDFVIPALSVQFLLHVISSIFLAYAILRAGLKVPLIAFALLIAHPTLVGMSGQVLTDSLATSIISCVFGVAIFLLSDGRRLPVKSLAFGFLVGLAVSLRLSLQVFAFSVSALVALGVFWGWYRRQGSVLAGFRRAAAFSCFFLCGLTPSYVHLVSNCYRSHHELCISPSSEAKSWMAESFNYTIKHARMWAIIKEDGMFRWGYTEDRSLVGCDVPNERAVRAMLSCYARNIKNLPAHFIKRAIGIFDNRHLNIHAVTRTTPETFWMVRSFSIVGYVGVFASFVLFFSFLRRRGFDQQVYLLLPLLYLAIQLNFHPETRYIYPVVPTLFVIGLSCLLRNQFSSRVWYGCFLGGALVVILHYLYQTDIWDSDSMRAFGLK